MGQIPRSTERICILQQRDGLGTSIKRRLFCSANDEVLDQDVQERRTKKESIRCSDAECMLNIPEEHRKIDTNNEDEWRK